MNIDHETPQDPSGDGEVKEVSINIPFHESFIYVNCAAFALSQMEIRVSFAEASHDGKAVSRAGIILPPEAAAVIALILFQQVERYEDKFGEIRHPLWRAMKAKQKDPRHIAKVETEPTEG